MEEINNERSQLLQRISELKAELRNVLEDKKATLKAELEAHTESFPEKLKHWGANTARAGVKGIYGMADLPFYAAELYKKGAEQEAHEMAPKHIPAPEPLGTSSWLPHMADRSEKAMAELTKGYSTPRTEGERLYGDLAQSVLPLGVLGKAAQVLNMAGKAPRVAQALTAVGKPTATNLGAATGSAFLSNRYREGNKNPDPFVDMALSLAGGVGGGFGAPAAIRGGKGVAKAAMSPRQTAENIKDTFAGKIGKKSGWNPDKWKRVVNTGQHPTMGMATDNPNVFKSEIALANDPITSNHFKKIYEANQDQLRKNLGVIKYSQPYEATQNPQYDLARQAANRLKAAKSDEYTRLNLSFNKRDQWARINREPVDVQDILSNFKDEGVGLQTKTAKGLFKERPSGSAVEKLQKMSHEEQQLQNKGAGDPEYYKNDMLNKGLPIELVDNQIKKMFPDYEPNPTTIAYPELDALRTKASLELEKIDPKVNANAYREARNVLHQYSKKRHQFIESIGTKAEIAASKAANKMWTEWMDKLEGGGKLIWDILDTTNEVDAFQRVMSKKEPRYLDIAIKGTPVSQQPALFDTIVTQMGKQNATGEFNVNQFVTQWESVKSPQWKHNLLSMKTEPESVAFKNTIRFISDNKKQLAQMENSSKSAHWLKWYEYPKKYKEALLATGVMGVAGFTGSWVPLTAALIWDATKYGGARLMTDRVFLERINRVITSPSNRVKATNFDNLTKYPPVKKALLQASRASLQSHGTNEKEKENE